VRLVEDGFYKIPHKSRRARRFHIAGQTSRTGLTRQVNMVCSSPETKFSPRNRRHTQLRNLDRVMDLSRPYFRIHRSRFMSPLSYSYPKEQRAKIPVQMRCHACFLPLCYAMASKYTLVKIGVLLNNNYYAEYSTKSHGEKFRHRAAAALQKPACPCVQR
jgi:hypothetical protein